MGPLKRIEVDTLLTLLGWTEMTGHIHVASLPSAVLDRFQKAHPSFPGPLPTSARTWRKGVWDSRSPPPRVTIYRTAPLYLVAWAHRADKKLDHLLRPTMDTVLPFIASTLSRENT